MRTHRNLSVRFGLLCIGLLLAALQARAGTALSLGTTYAGTIALPGQTNQYTFNGVPGQRLYFDSLDVDTTPINVALISPGGVLLYSRNDDYDAGPWVLTEPGAYSLVFSANGSTTGNYEFRLLDLAAAPALTPGATLTDQLSPPLACNIYQFKGTRGQRVNLQSLDYSTNQAQWQLVSPANTVLASGQIYQNLGANTLPLDGEYCVMVIGTAPGSTPLTFQLLVADASDSPVAASGFGTVHAGTVNANQTNSFTYSAPAGLPVYFNSLDRSGQSLVVDLVDPTGKPVPGFFGLSEISDAGPYVLPRSGTYAFNVRGPGGASGNFDFRLLDLTASPALPLNTMVSNVLAAPYQTDVYQLAGTAGQRLYYDSLLGTFANVQVRLLGPDGQTTLAGNSYSDEGPATLSYSGGYYLFQQSQLTTGPTYVFQIWDVAAAAALPLNTDLSGTLAPNSTLLYQLAGTNGEQLYFNAKGVTAGGATWSLYNGGNTQVPGGSANLGGDFEVTLPYQCNYVLVLTTGANPVGYSNQVGTFGYTTNALTLGASVTNNIVHPGDQLVYTFTGNAGQRVYYDALNGNTYSITMTMVSPTGLQVIYGNASYDLGPLSLPETGTYTLFFNGSGDTTGSISFQLLDLGAQPALPLNVDLTGALAADTSQIFQLAGTVGEQLYFDSKSVSAGGASWYLYGPNNALVSGANLAGDFEVTLANQGMYALVLAAGPNALTYSNQVNSFAYTTNALTLGTVVTNNITAPGNQIVYTFSGTAGQRIYFDSLNPAYVSITVTLVSPTGVSLVSGNASYDFQTPITLPTTGVYSLQFDGSGHTIGGISFQLLDVAAQPPLPLNTDLTGTLPANSTILYQLNGVSGQQIYFYSKGVTGGGSSWTLYGPNNAYLNAAAFSQDFLQTLLYTGNYVLALQGGGNAVSYTNQVNTFSYVTNAITLNTELTTTIVHPGDQLFYTFSGVAGQRLYFDSRQTNYVNVQFALLSPTGVSVTSGNVSYDSPLPFTLTQTGAYTLVLNGLGHTTGTVGFDLLDLAAATPVSLGTTVTGSLSDGSETRLYRFDGAAGQRVNLQSLSGGNQATWELINLTDQVLGQNLYLSQSIGTVTLPATGAYIVAVVGNGTTTTPIPYQWSLADSSDSPVAAAGFGSVNSGNVAANQTNTFSYTAPAGLPVFFDSQDTSGQNLSVDLFSPDGTSVFSVNETSDAGPFILPRSGTYKLNVRGYNGASGNFSFRVLDLSTSPILPFNTPMNGALDNPFETDVYQFTNSPGQTFIYNALTNDVNYPSVFVQMLNPAGQSVGPAGDFQNNRGPFNIQYAGTSYFLVRNGRNLASTYSLQLLDVSAQPVLPIGTAQTNILNQYPLNVYRYTGTAGQQLFFHGQAANPSGYWTLYDPNNAGVPGSGPGLASDFEVTLPWNGTYALIFSSYASSAGTEIFQADSFSYVTNSYAIGTPLVDAISQSGERRFYTFSGTLGQRLIYNALTNDPPSPSVISIQLLNPQGAQEGPIGGRFSNNRGPFTLQESGTFTLVVDGSGASTGTFAFQLLDVSTQPVLPLNTAVSNTLGVYPLEVYQYNGTAGKQLYFHGQSGNPSGFWTLYDPNNNQVSGSSLAGDFEVSLPMIGTYSLVLGNYSASSGTEGFQVNDYSYFTNAYTIGSAVVDAINRPGERKFYAFSGEIGQRLVYNALTNDPPSPNTITLQLLNPEGVGEGSIGGRFSNNRGPFTLQESGTYTLVFDGSSSSVGTFAFQLLDVAAQPALPISAGVTNALQVYPLEIYQYTGVPGQHLYFRGLSTNPSGYWTLYDPNNSSLSGAGLVSDFQTTLPMAGTYVLMLGSYSTSAGTEVFQINPFNDGETPIINRAPVLSFITNQVVGVGVPVLFTAQATDPDNNTLTFSLDPGSPPGATINPATGSFAWTPPVTGLSSVTPITVRVTDNGTPSLSAAETLSVEVIAGPSMITVQLNGSMATPFWHSAPTKHYRLQFKNELSDSVWQAVGADVTAIDVITSQPDNSIGTNSHRFYRVQALDPLP